MKSVRLTEGVFYGGSHQAAGTILNSVSDADAYDFQARGLATIYDGTTQVIEDYITAAGLTDTESLRRLRAFAAKLAEDDLLSPLVDAWFFRSGQNDSASPIALRGNAITQTGVVWKGDGIHFPNGVTSRVLATVDPVKAHTFVVEHQGNANNSSAWIGGITNAAAGAPGCAAGTMISSGVGAYYSREGGTATVTTGTLGDTGHFGLVHRYNTLPQVVAASFNNAADLNVYVDGFLASNKTSSLTAVTSNLDRMILGQRQVTASTYDSQYEGIVQAALLFSRVLTAAEHRTVERALRLLNPRRKNLVTYGDSLTAQISDATRTGGNWPLQLTKFRPFADHRLYNVAKNGWTAATGASSFDGRVNYFEPDNTAVFGTDFIVLFGTNDVLASTAAATIWGNIQSICRQARAIGYRTFVATVPDSAAFDAGMDTIVGTLNGLIAAGEGIDFDGLIDLADFCGTAPGGASGNWLDDTHPNNAGNLTIADFIARGGKSAVTAF